MEHLQELIVYSISKLRIWKAYVLNGNFGSEALVILNVTFCWIEVVVAAGVVVASTIFNNELQI